MLHIGTKGMLSLLIGLLFAACSRTGIEEDHITVTGEITNYDLYSEYQSIKFSIPNPFSATSFEGTAYLDDSGHFAIRLPQYYPHDIWFVFKNVYGFYSTPGDSIHLTIDADILKTEQTPKQKEIYRYITLTGDAERINKDFFKYIQFSEDSLWDWEKEAKAVKDLGPDEYKKYVEERTISWETKLKDFVRRNHTCKPFREFAFNDLKYRKLDDLMRYRWLHPHYNHIDRDSFLLSHNYFGFLERTDFNHEDLILSYRYLGFLHEYSMYVDRELIPADSLEKGMEYYKNHEEVRMQSIFLRNILNQSSGFLRQILLAKFYFQLLEWNEPEIFDSLYHRDMFTYKDYADLVEQKYDVLMENLKDPAFYTDRILKDLRNYNNNILSSLIKKYPGKVLYIDFWAPWCGPCMEEMEDANTLYDKYRNKDVIFVYLANRCTEKSWKIAIAKMNIRGKHLLLTDEQYGQLSDRFDITGIPHHILINKEGNIVNANAPRPGNVEKITTTLDRLLEE